MCQFYYQIYQDCGHCSEYNTEKCEGDTYKHEHLEKLRIGKNPPVNFREIDGECEYCMVKKRRVNEKREYWIMRIRVGLQNFSDRLMLNPPLSPGSHCG
jgi:hypothetical protein